MGNAKYVVACVNGVPPSLSVCDYASWLTQKLGKELKLLHTLEQKYSETASDLSGNIGLGARDELLEELVAIEHEQKKILQRKAKVILEASRRRVERNGVPAAKLCLRHGRLLENLLDIQEEVELIVIGRYGKTHQTVSEKGIGHKVEAVIRAVEKPVLVVSKAFHEPKSILLAYDGSAASVKALSYLEGRQVFRGLEVHVVYVGERAEKSEAFISEAMTKLQASGQLVQGEHLSGDAGQAIMDYIAANDIGLTVMGAFGHHWLRNLLVGSFTSTMLAASDKPLLLVR